MPAFDTLKAISVDHKWHFHKALDCHVCLLCGAVTVELPPVPTPETWMPFTYMKLSKELRAIYAKLKK